MASQEASSHKTSQEVSSHQTSQEASSHQTLDVLTVMVAMAAAAEHTQIWVVARQAGHTMPLCPQQLLSSCQAEIQLIDLSSLSCHPCPAAIEQYAHVLDVAGTLQPQEVNICCVVLLTNVLHAACVGRWIGMGGSG